MKAVTRNATRTPVRTWYLEEGGILEAVRTMGENKIREVVVLNRQGEAVGTFRFEDGRISFESDGESSPLS